MPSGQSQAQRKPNCRVELALSFLSDPLQSKSNNSGHFIVVTKGGKDVDGYNATSYPTIHVFSFPAK